MSKVSFKDFVTENDDSVVITFGRMNPPTIGHQKLFDSMKRIARGGPYKVYLSQSVNEDSNPLAYTTKVKHIRRLFPRHARNVISNRQINTVFDALVDSYQSGYKDLVFVAGQDRIVEFEALIEKYNGKHAKHGFYKFRSIKVESSGDRDPDKTDVEGMSASKQRMFAEQNDFASFAAGLPHNAKSKDIRNLFNDVRIGMGLEQATQYAKHVELQPVSETREKYVSGELFNVDDYVVIKETEEIGKIAVLGSNYVIVEGDFGRKRKWLEDVELTDPPAYILDEDQRQQLRTILNKGLRARKPK